MAVSAVRHHASQVRSAAIDVRCQTSTCAAVGAGDSGSDTGSGSAMRGVYGRPGAESAAPSAPRYGPGMRSTEVRAIGELAGRTLAGTGTMVRDLHMAVAGRAFAAVGPGGAPARAVHDGVAGAVYGAVGRRCARCRRRRGGASRARPRSMRPRSRSRRAAASRSAR